MGQHWSHLTPTKRIQLDAFIRAGMKPTDIAKELGVRYEYVPAGQMLQPVQMT